MAQAGRPLRVHDRSPVVVLGVAYARTAGRRMAAARGAGSAGCAAPRSAGPVDEWRTVRRRGARAKGSCRRRPRRRVHRAVRIRRASPYAGGRAKGGRARRVTLGIVYHMPFWRGPDGTLRELEGSFARYVDSLAPYFDEISLCVPVLRHPAGEGTPIRSSNVTLAPLPAFDGPVQFYPRLASVLPRLMRWGRRIDLLHCRVPSPAAVFAFAIARLLRRPVFLLVVGDLRALLPSMPYRGVKRGLWRAYTEFEERNIQWMANHS